MQWESDDGTVVSTSRCVVFVEPSGDLAVLFDSIPTPAGEAGAFFVSLSGVCYGGYGENKDNGPFL